MMFINKCLKYIGLQISSVKLASRSKKNNSKLDIEIEKDFFLKKPKKKILIALAVHNRPVVTQICLENLTTYLDTGNKLVIYDDASTAFENDFFSNYTDQVVKFEKNMGIGWSRFVSLCDFVCRYKEYDLLYLTDNDTVHDSRFLCLLSHLFELQETNGEVEWPVGLFNSNFHKKSVVAQNSTLSLVNTCPGISMCLTRKMALEIFEAVRNEPLTINSHWDWEWPKVLGQNFLIPKISYVEHFARDRFEAGLHSSNSGGDFESAAADFDFDRALNPSDELIKTRLATINKILGIEVDENQSF